MKIILPFSVFFLVFCMKSVESICPYGEAGLVKWSTSIGTKSNGDENITISGDILLDKNVNVFGIHITKGAKLVVDSVVTDIKAYYILVEGELHVGSEGCLFPNKLTITLRGTSKDSYTVPGLTCQKCINVIANGVLELHGKHKRPWTRLAVTLKKVPSKDILYSEEVEKTKDQKEQITGLLVRAFDSKTGSLKASKDLKFRKQKLIAPNTKIFKDLAEEQNDDCVVIAMRKAILRKNDGNAALLNDLYNEIEKLGFGKVTDKSCIRDHTFYDAYAMVACKGDKSLTRESCGEYRLGNTFQTVDECVVLNGFKFCGTSYSNSRNHGKSKAIFEVTKAETSVPTLTLKQTPRQWKEGDEICVVSSDYDWEQRECGRMVKCPSCNPKQIKVDKTFRFDHFGEEVNNVDMAAEVFVTTRNVRVTSEMENFNAEDGGMIKYSEGFLRGKIENVELKQLGDSGKLGVYPVHYHMCKNVVGKTYARYNSIHDSWSRCFAIHGTMGTIVDRNTCSDFKGHGYFTEDGGERNSAFTNNLAVGARKADPKIFTQLDRSPACFFISNPDVQFSGNIAAGGIGPGIQFIFPDEPTGPSEGLKFMEKDQAKKVQMDINNNAAHSHLIGFKFAQRLSLKNRKTAYNKYQPQDASGKPVKTSIKHLTAYKNKDMNALFEGGFIEVSDSSFSDSAIGVMFSRAFPEKDGNFIIPMKKDKLREEPGQKPSLINSVILGDSINKGLPQNGSDRSLPNEKDNTVTRCGIMATSGVWSVDNTWFAGFDKNAKYETGAICFQNPDKFVVSPRNTFKNVRFGFEDPTGGKRVLDTVKESDLPKAEVGNKVAIFYDKEGKVTSKIDAYVIHPTDFQKSDNSQTRTSWGLEVSEEPVAQVRVKTSAREVKMMRSDGETESSPSANTAAFNVITGNKFHYVMKMSEYKPSLTIGGIGISKDRSILLGVCVPFGSTVDIKLSMPSKIRKPKMASSKAALESSNTFDYFYDEVVGVVFFKLTHSESFAADSVDECPNGLCPNAVLKFKGGDTSKIDCFKAYKDTYPSASGKRRRRRRRSVDVLPSSELPANWGAGEFILTE